MGLCGEDGALVSRADVGAGVAPIRACTRTENSHYCTSRHRREPCHPAQRLRLPLRFSPPLRPALLPRTKTQVPANARAALAILQRIHTDIMGGTDCQVGSGGKTVGCVRPPAALRGPS